jgi:hypothetical protein
MVGGMKTAKIMSAELCDLLTVNEAGSEKDPITFTFPTVIGDSVLRDAEGKVTDTPTTGLPALRVGDRDIPLKNLS